MPARRTIFWKLVRRFAFSQHDGPFAAFRYRSSTTYTAPSGANSWHSESTSRSSGNRGIVRLPFPSKCSVFGDVTTILPVSHFEREDAASHPFASDVPSERGMGGGSSRVIRGSGEEPRLAGPTSAARRRYQIHESISGEAEVRPREADANRLPVAQHERFRRTFHQVDQPGMPRPVHRLWREAIGSLVFRVPRPLSRGTSAPIAGQRTVESTEAARPATDQTRKDRGRNRSTRRGSLPLSFGRPLEKLLATSGVASPRCLFVIRLRYQCAPTCARGMVANFRLAHVAVRHSAS